MMNAMDLAHGGSGLGRLLRHPAALIVAFTATIFLSALLLFSVQPMFARMVLPKLGGSPSVWAVSMCFFQATLLAGYCYAHALNRFAGPRQALGLHVLLLALACLALPIALPASASEPPSGDAYLWLVGILALGVGLPFLAVSANAPLLQSWFGRTGHPDAADPYFLYAASNVGSLAALLAYPVIVEPLLGLGLQATVWTVGFVLLASMIAVCGALMIVNGRPQSGASAPSAAAQVVTWRQRALWVGLAFIPSGLLVAFTTYLTTDIASAPFLWVVPLAIFLATFIVTFRERPLFTHELMVTALPALVVLCLAGMTLGGTVGSKIAFAASFLGFVCASLVCHRELYLRRPEASSLTEFYLWMSLGGVLGGVFAALVAPNVFTWVIEFPLLLALALFARPQVLAGDASQAERRSALLLLGAGIGGLLLADAVASALSFPSAAVGLATALALLVAWPLVRSKPFAELALVAILVGATIVASENRGAQHVVRSFFGVHKVMDNPDGSFRVLFHGTTVHGAQRLLDASGKPLAAPVPATYYSATAPMVRSVGLAREAKRGGAMSMGVVGLGAGTMACFAEKADRLRFYEIDQAVVDIARDPRHFGFLSKCRPDTDIVLGDARLTIAKEAKGSFDYLLIDAFSSDAIPVHLLTVEALALYLEKVAPGGVLALHVSNRHMSLPPIVAANLAHLPGLSAVLVEDARPAGSLDVASSRVVLISRDRAALAPALSWPGARRLEPTGAKAWTDDYSDLVSAILAKSWN
jgi:hypothetical protein